MRLKGILITLVVLLSLIFAAVNWQTLTTALPVNLLFTTVQLPLGLTLLLTAVGLSVLFFVLAYLDRLARLRQAAQLEHRLNEAHEKLEARRLTELDVIDRNVTDRVVALDAKVDSSTRRVLERLDRLENRLPPKERIVDTSLVEDSVRRRAVGEG